MSTEKERLPKLAVLIDADNASSRIAAGLFEEIATIGEASVRRIYGDFSKSQLRGWADVLSRHAIIPQQNFAQTVGKNASDIALVIDAMDLLHSGRFDGFCLVSSDSDFTRLAARIREQGVDVFGFREQKTPESFRQACKRFYYTENLLTAPAAAEIPVVEPKPKEVKKQPAAAASTKKSPSAAIPAIRKAIGQLEDVDGWYALSAIGSRLNILMPDFDPRSYGCPKLVTLIEKCGVVDIRRDQKHISVRLKEKKPVAV